MKNIFKRRKKPLIIAPPHPNFYVPGSHKIIIPSSNDTVVISDPKTVSGIERVLEHQRGTSKNIKIINTAGNFEEIADGLRNNGYMFEVKGG